MTKFLLNCPEPPAKLKLEPKKIQKSDENLRAELTHILLTRQHNA
jgi:hypothetical protein